VAPREVGENLAQMGGSSDLLETLLEGLPDSSRSDAHAVLASLTLLACRRVLESGVLNFSPASKQAIYDGLIVALATERVRTFGLSEDCVDTFISDMVNRADLFATIWNESIGRQPAPHHYVAKEGWFMICGDRSNPDLTRIVLLSGTLSATSTTVMEFLREARPLIQDL